MPPKAKKSKKEIEEEKSIETKYLTSYRKTRGRKEDSRGAGEEATGGRGKKETHRGREETCRRGKETR